MSGVRSIKQRASASLGPNLTQNSNQTRTDGQKNPMNGGSAGLAFEESVYARKNGKKLTTLSQQRRQITGIG